MKNVFFFYNIYYVQGREAIIQLFKRHILPSSKKYKKLFVNYEYYIGTWVTKIAKTSNYLKGYLEEQLIQVQ